MAGIFPRNGVPAIDTQGADPTIAPGDLVNCEGNALFHPVNRCPPRFDPRSLNTLISEITNAVNCAGIDYDCSIFNNLCLAMQAMNRIHVLHGRDERNWPPSNPLPSTAGSLHTYSVVIPNTSPFTIPVFVRPIIHALVVIPTGTTDTMSMNMNLTSPGGGNVGRAHMNWGGQSSSILSYDVFNNRTLSTLMIPPGGRTVNVDVELASVQQTSGTMRIQNFDTFLDWYGVGGMNLTQN